MICLRDPGTGKSPASQQCSACKVACWAKRRYPLVCGWVHWSRTLPPTQGDTRSKGHHWKRRRREERRAPLLNSYWEGHERKTGLTLKGWSSCIMGVHGCTQEMKRQHVSSSTIQRFHWVSIASSIPLSPFMLSWRREEIVVLTGWLFINHSHIAWQPVRREFITKLNDSHVKDFDKVSLDQISPIHLFHQQQSEARRWSQWSGN